MTPDEAKAHIDTYERQPGIDLVALIDRADMEDALETVAGMRYEYAIQIVLDGWWVFFAPHGGKTMNADYAKWEKTRSDAESTAAAYPRHRTVRRLVGDIEVCEAMTREQMKAYYQQPFKLGKSYTEEED